MSEYENALSRIDDELHGVDYELYLYLHDVLSHAIELEAQLKAEEKAMLQLALDGGRMYTRIEELEAVIADVLIRTEVCDEYISGDAARMVIRDVRKAIKRGE